MAVSLSASVRNRRKGRDNHTDREGRKPPDWATRSYLGVGPLGQTEKDGHSRGTAGQPPTAEMLTDWPAQSVSAVNRRQLVDPEGPEDKP